MEQCQRGRYGCRNFRGRTRTEHICYVNWSKLIQAGLAATNASQVSTVPDCFGGQIKYKPNTPYVFKARIKQGAEITFRIVYEDGTKEVLSAPPAGTEGVYEVVHTIDASRVVQKIYMYVGKGVSMYLYDIQLTEGNKAPRVYHGRRGCAGADRTGEVGCGLHCLGFEPDTLR